VAYSLCGDEQGLWLIVVGYNALAVAPDAPVPLPIRDRFFKRTQTGGDDRGGQVFSGCANAIERRLPVVRLTYFAAHGAQFDVDERNGAYVSWGTTA